VEIERVNTSLLDDPLLKSPAPSVPDPCTRSWTGRRGDHPYPQVRRGYIAQKYAALIDALYGDADRVAVEAR